MATTAMDYENANGDRYEDDGPRYERDQRSASPRPMRDDGADTRRRSASPNGNAERSASKDESGPKDQDDGAINPGSNLFVTGIHPRLTEGEVTRLFEKYGEVEKCQIMKDPHTKESRGFGFVKMMTPEQADAAKDGLQGEVIEGRTLSIEKARRSRPRTPTPGKYFGPPKREGGGPGGGPGTGTGRRPFGERGDDRRRGGYSGAPRGEDPYRYRGYERRYDEGRGADRGYREERGYDRSYRGDDRGGYDRGFRDDRGYDRNYRDDRGSGYDRRDRDEGYAGGGRMDRYGGGREDRERHGGARGGFEERRGGASGGGYDRDAPRAARDQAPPAATGYSEAAPRPDGREPYAGPDRHMR